MCSFLDRLVEERGLGIAYIHFTAGFAHKGEVDAEFRIARLCRQGSEIIRCPVSIYDQYRMPIICTMIT